MTQDWSDLPSHLLSRRDTTTLMQWLRARGLQMTLLELDTERRQRGIQPPLRKN
jgi:hypothetical protein